jgi:hypothetical protein
LGQRVSLALAKAVLANDGIRHPTPDQLNAALTGGTVTKADGTTVTIKGVLELRAQGMGWGQVAHAEDTKLGPVLASLHSERHQFAALPHEHDHVATAGGAQTHHDGDGDHDKRLASTSGAHHGDDSGQGKGLVTAGARAPRRATRPRQGHRHRERCGFLAGWQGPRQGIVTAAGAGAPTGVISRLEGITTAAGGGERSRHRRHARRRCGHGDRVGRAGRQPVASTAQGGATRGTEGARARRLLNVSEAPSPRAPCGPFLFALRNQQLRRLLLLSIITI